METVAKQLGSRVVASETSAKELQRQVNDCQSEKSDLEAELKDCKRAIKELSSQSRVETASLVEKERITHDRMRELKEKYDELQREMELRSEEHAKMKVRQGVRYVCICALCCCVLF